MKRNLILMFLALVCLLSTLVACSSSSALKVSISEIEDVLGFELKKDGTNYSADGEYESAECKTKSDNDVVYIKYICNSKYYSAEYFSEDTLINAFYKYTEYMSFDNHLPGEVDAVDYLNTCAGLIQLADGSDKEFSEYLDSALDVIIDRKTYTSNGWTVKVEILANEAYVIMEQ